MEVTTEDDSVTETGSDSDTVEEELNLKQAEKYVKKKTKTKEKEISEKTKKDDVKKLGDGTSAAVAKRTSPRLKELALRKEQLQNQEKEKLRREVKKMIHQEEAELDHNEKLIKEKEKKQFSLYTCFFVLFVIAIIFALIFIFACNWYGKSQMFNSQQNSDPQRLLKWEKSFSDMISKYGSVLPNSSRKVIFKSVQRVLNRITPSIKYNNNEPAVVLLVGSTHNAKAVRCVLSTLSKSLATIFQENHSPIIKAEQLSPLDLTNEIHKVLGHSKLHTVALDGIERLHGSAALSLHPFTDHDKATYLDVIILLTAYTNNQLTNTNIQVEEIDQIANNLLEICWGKILPQEQVAGLLSRITPSVAIISDTVESQHWNCD